MSVSAISVRRAAPDDVFALGRLGALLVRAHHEFDPQRFIAPTPETEHGYGEFLGTQLDSPDVFVFVAVTERDGVVGYIYAPRAVLSTAARNEAAQRLFARMGFRPTMIEMSRES